MESQLVLIYLLNFINYTLQRIALMHLQIQEHAGQPIHVGATIMLPSNARRFSMEDVKEIEITLNFLKNV